MDDELKEFLDKVVPGDPEEDEEEEEYQPEPAAFPEQEEPAT